MKIKVINLVKLLQEKSFQLGYWNAIWESSPGGVGKSTKEIDAMQKEVDALVKAFETMLGDE